MIDNEEFVIIQYPGIVKNVDKALVTLGGMSQISQVRIKFSNADKNSYAVHFKHLYYLLLRTISKTTASL